MPKFARDTAIAIAAGAVVLLLTVLIDGIPLGWQIVITAVAAVVAFVVALIFFSSEDETQGADTPSKKIEVGTDLDSTGSTNVRRTEVVSNEDKDVAIGKRVRADGDINIEDVSVRRADDSE